MHLYECTSFITQQPNGSGPMHKGDNEYDTQNLMYLLGSILHSENSREFKGF